MAQEIERKFLVSGPFKTQAREHIRVVQGYLSTAPERTVRVRIAGDQAFLTIKGIGSASGASRFEWEHGISVADAEELLALCEPGVIEKTRHLVRVGAHLFEVDEFHGVNEGLIVAEVELASEDESFRRPEWLGEEVTGDARYSNAVLVKRPYASWSRAP